MMAKETSTRSAAGQSTSRAHQSARVLSTLIAITCGLSLALACVPRIAYAWPFEAAVNAASKNSDEDPFASLKACKGKSADYALKSAQDSGIDANFVDSFDVDVTEYVTDAKNGSEVHKAKVTEVKTHDLWILGKSVTFVLDYTDPNAKKERDEKDKSKNDKKEAEKKLGSCVGSSAWEAYELSQTAGYGITFEDSFGIDVTEDVIDGGKTSDVGKASVTDIKLSDPWLFVPGSATAQLDYVEPEAAQEREMEKQRKQKEQEFRKNKASIEGTEGEPIGKAQQLIDGLGYDYEIRDVYGTDVTKKVRKAKKGTGIRKSIVTSVTVSDDFESPFAIFDIDYNDPSSLKRIAKEKGYPAEVTFSDITAEVEDEHPSYDSPTFSVTVSGTITSNDTWQVDESSLPRLGTIDENLDYCAVVDLDGEGSRLGGGESTKFVYHYRLYYGSDPVVLKTENDSVVIHGGNDLINAVNAKFEDAKKYHDANVEKAKEDEYRAWEEERKSQTCYYTATGNCYHSYTGCPALSRSKNIYETSVGEAESWGLDACDRCH